MFEIEYAEGVANDLKLITAYQRAIILDRIDEQLSHQPAIETKVKKKIVGLRPPWHHEEPLWQLRVNEFRVFYDVNEEARKVVVRAIRRKPPQATAEEIV